MKIRILSLLFLLVGLNVSTQASYRLLEEGGPVLAGGPEFTLTPNPVNGSHFHVNINFSENDYPDAAIVISDVLGKIVYFHGLKKSDFIEGRVRIAVMDASLDKGVYFVQVKSGDYTRTLKLAIR